MGSKAPQPPPSDGVARHSTHESPDVPPPPPAPPKEYGSDTAEERRRPKPTPPPPPPPKEYAGVDPASGASYSATFRVNVAPVLRKLDEAEGVIARQAAEVRDLRDAIRLIVGRQTGWHWSKVPEREVDAYLASIRELKG